MVINILSLRALLKVLKHIKLKGESFTSQQYLSERKLLLGPNTSTNTNNNTTNSGVNGDSQEYSAITDECTTNEATTSTGGMKCTTTTTMTSSNGHRGEMLDLDSEDNEDAENTSLYSNQLI